MEAPQTLRHSRWPDLLLWLLRRRQRLRVVGRSMLPLLQPGEEVLVDPAAYVRSHRGAKHNSPECFRPQPGDIVVAHPPHNSELRIVKWVVFVEDDGRCYLKGLNPEESTDSRNFGLVSPTSILGRVVCRFP